MNNNFAELFKQERQRLCLTQAQVARACNINRATVTQYEAGKNSPSIDLIYPLTELGFDMCKVLQISPKAVENQPAPDHKLCNLNLNKHNLSKRIVARLPGMSDLPTESINRVLDSYRAVLLELEDPNATYK